MTLPNPHFEDSYARVFGDGVSMNHNADAFFARFYEHFLATPEVAAMFAHTNLSKQQLMLKKSLLHLVSYYALGELPAELQRLAQRHVELGVDAELLDVWMQALLQTLREFDDDMDEVTELAWCWAMDCGLTYMRRALRDGSNR